MKKKIYDLEVPEFMDPKTNSAWRKNRKLRLFLTSSPNPPGSSDINIANDFATSLMREVPQNAAAVFITSFPEDRANNAKNTQELRQAMERIGMTFSRFAWIDGMNASSAERIVRTSDLIVLGGGHVPTQRKFFESIHLKELLKDYKGVMMTISAGSMNCADEVYSTPELKGEAIDPTYERFFPGLGLTTRHIMPHYHFIKDMLIDGIPLFGEIIMKDSHRHDVYAMPDGTWIYIEGDTEVLHGECYLYSKGTMRKINEDNKTLRL